GVRGAAAVAGEQQLAAVAQGVHAQPRGLLQLRLQRRVRGQRLHVAHCLVEFGGDRRAHRAHGTLHAVAPPGLKWKSSRLPPCARSAVDSRTRSTGSQTNIMKPPPPAPETLVARAPLSIASASSASIIGLLMLLAMRFFASQPCCRVRAKPARSPCSRFSFICTASALSWCMASSE